MDKKGWNRFVTCIWTISSYLATLGVTMSSTLERYWMHLEGKESQQTHKNVNGGRASTIPRSHWRHIYPRGKSSKHGQLRMANHEKRIKIIFRDSFLLQEVPQTHCCDVYTHATSKAAPPKVIWTEGMVAAFNNIHEFMCHL